MRLTAFDPPPPTPMTLISAKCSASERSGMGGSPAQGAGFLLGGPSTGPTLICEGLEDALSLAMLGIGPVIGLPGVAALKHLELPKVADVVVFRDGDEAGSPADKGLIAGTGNYGFFNLLTCVLCVSWLDDAFLLRFLPLRPRFAPQKPPTIPPSRARRFGFALAAVALAFASSLAFVEEMVRTRPPGRIDGLAGSLLDAGAKYVAAGEPILTVLGPFRSVNGYGLFRSMTTERPEIAIEASDDNITWHEMVFRYKAGDVHRRPQFVAPHQPRLDWQMWFAALDPRRAGPWLQRLLHRILEGSPPVLRLFDDTASLAKPPRYVRLVMYDYRFTTVEEASQEGHAWWKRERRGELTSALSLESFRR
jgi:hypothetical protein